MALVIPIMMIFRSNGYQTCDINEYNILLVVTGLVMNGDKQDEDIPGGLVRLQAVRTLCQMNPSQALNVRTLCVSPH